MAYEPRAHVDTTAKPARTFLSHAPGLGRYHKCCEAVRERRIAM